MPPGPRPDPIVIWRDLYRVWYRLLNASENEQQRHVAEKLRLGLRSVEHLWGVKRDGSTPPFKAEHPPAVNSAANSGE